MGARGTGITWMAYPLSLFSPLPQGSNFNLKLFKGRFCAKLWFEKDSKLKDS